MYYWIKILDMLVLSVSEEMKIIEEICLIGVSALIEYRGETYLTATEVARQFKVSRGTCY